MVLTLSDKFIYTFLTMVVFYAVANPRTFDLTQSLFGKFITVADGSGCPTCYGLILHSIVFGLILLGLMELPFGKTAVAKTTVAKTTVAKTAVAKTTKVGGVEELMKSKNSKNDDVGSFINLVPGTNTGLKEYTQPANSFEDGWKTAKSGCGCGSNCNGAGGSALGWGLR